MTVPRLALAAVAGLLVASPAFAKGGMVYGSTGFSASADAASLSRMRDARPIGSKPETQTPTRDQPDKVLEALKPGFQKKK
jgi:hypothetical protein